MSTYLCLMSSLNLKFLSSSYTKVMMNYTISYLILSPPHFFTFLSIIITNMIRKPAQRSPVTNVPSSNNIIQSIGMTLPRAHRTSVKVIENSNFFHLDSIQSATHNYLCIWVENKGGGAAHALSRYVRGFSHTRWLPSSSSSASRSIPFYITWLRNSATKQLRAHTAHFITITTMQSML